MTSAWTRLARHQSGPARLDIGPGPFSSTSVRAHSARHGLGSTLLNLRLNFLGSTWIGPSQNPTQNRKWIIQKCIKSISNPYPIKWIGFKIQKYGFGFEINPFKWIKTNMDLDNYGLDFVIWIFCPPLVGGLFGSIIVLRLGWGFDGQRCRENGFGFSDVKCLVCRQRRISSLKRLWHPQAEISRLNLYERFGYYELFFYFNPPMPTLRPFFISFLSL